ncbi:MAG: cobyrinate a,c-diamide synthase, partial [Gammaproteobacteria bacterium]|nr:cobyrinate a,c-diamide synthase [Gammaproteobacteria bacterium]
MAHMFISAAHKSSGKTTISIGLTALLARRGLDVAPCKKGPDYIDPIWLSLAANRSCANLDTFISSDEEVIEDFYAATENADISLIEGNKGLYDGVALDGSNSNAAVAKLLKAPVILVIDCRGMTRGIAPLLIGYQMFDADIRIAGVILNRVGGARHEAKLRASVEHFTTIPVLGAVHENPGLSIDEEHLGLIPGNELADAKDKINAIADFLAPALDLEKIIEIASSAERPAKTLTFKPDYKNYGQYAGLRIAIARDRAFGFYYPGDLQKFREYGAEL